MKVQILLILASLAIASGQNRLDHEVDSQRVSAPSREGWLQGALLNGLSKVKQFSKWLLTPASENFEKHSDKVDYEISKAQTNQLRDSRVVDSDVVDYETPQSQLGSMEKLFKKGRGAFSQMNTVRIFYESLGAWGSCVITREWTDRDLGHMPLNASTYCDMKCGRMIPGVSCCQPAKPDAIDAKLLLFRPGHKGRVLDWRNPNEASLLKSQSGRVVFITHGFIEKISLTTWMSQMVDGFHANGDTAVIVVDWRGGNALQYGQAIANLRTVGAVVGHAIGIWGIADQTLFVGFSLGGQMVGEAAKYLTRKFGQKIAECHGLDPAGPLFDGCPTEITLDKDDCQLTQVIHTSASDVPTVQAALIRFGTFKKAGHCDYWVNCGYNQDPCLDIGFPEMVKGLVRLGAASDGELGDWIMSRGGCSHWRAPLVYIAALTRNATCPAYECPTCGQTHFCTPASVQANQPSNRLPPFSHCSPNDDVDYYVASDSFAPYCVS